jgi:hypothetical protein
MNMIVHYSNLFNDSSARPWSEFDFLTYMSFFDSSPNVVPQIEHKALARTQSALAMEYLPQARTVFRNCPMVKDHLLIEQIEHLMLFDYLFVVETQLLVVLDFLLVVKMQYYFHKIPDLWYALV